MPSGSDVGEPGVDYFDRSEEDDGGETPEYRSLDLVGTQAGSSEIGAMDTFGGRDSPINDVPRRRFATLDLPEYQVRVTEGGEWLNYTREFTEHAYTVFLRVAARASQQVFLDEVTSDPSLPNQTTTRAGIFEVPNLGMKTNYRFVPLTDENGPFKVETAAVFSDDSVSIPISESAEFFRFRLSTELGSSFVILAVEFSANNLVIRFAR